MKNVAMITLTALTLSACTHFQRSETPETASGTSTSSTPPTTESLAPQKAQAVLKSVKGENIKGTIHFYEQNGVIKIEALVDNLKPGPHGFHIHAKGDCSSADFSSAGGHFNPTHKNHGSLDSKVRHAGDLGNLIADNKRKAYTSFETKSLTLAGAQSIIGKSIIIHKDQDDLKSQPTGNSGARIACGVIEAL